MSNSVTLESSPQFQRLIEIILFKYRRLLTHILKKTLRQVSNAQFTLLEILFNHKTLNMGQIAKLMGHSTPATTGMIDRLVNIHLVERTQMPNDRRQILIKITPEGAALVTQAKIDLFNAMYELSKKMSLEDQQAWFRINELIYQQYNS